MAENQVNFEISVPEQEQGGHYANFLSVWHTPYEFTLDFAVIEPSKQEDGAVTVPCKVVSRVRIPVTVLFDVLKALNENMTQYEEKFGEIRPPEPKGDAK